MSTVRDVSPIGASRFERPYSPLSVRTSAATSPTDSRARFHFSKPSITSTAETYSTAPTLIGSPDCELKGISAQPCVLPEDAEEWSDKLPRSDSDAYLEDTDECPDRATLAAVQEMPLYDGEGNTRTFGSLYDPDIAGLQRQLVIFIRYFYCPACTLFIKALTEGIGMHDYFSIPVPTSIVIVGCGKPDIINHYKKFTGCPFPIYADPSRMLFKKLDMNVSFNIGKRRPDYMGEFSLLGGSMEEIRTLRKSLKDPEGLRKRDLLRGGNPMQIGGEFLFEQGEVLWCHRMTNYRNHAEIKHLRRVLQLDD